MNSDFLPLGKKIDYITVANIIIVKAHRAQFGHTHGNNLCCPKNKSRCVTKHELRSYMLVLKKIMHKLGHSPIHHTHHLIREISFLSMGQKKGLS